MKPLYQNRPLSEGYPELEKLGVEYFKRVQDDQSRVPEILQCIARLMDLSTGLKTVAVVGCGPHPWSVKELLNRGYDAVGVEPVAGSVNAAAEFLGDPARVRHGNAEPMPFDTNSQRIVLMESVLKHVDSPSLALGEAYRVLAPGGFYLSILPTGLGSR